MCIYVCSAAKKRTILKMSCYGTGQAEFTEAELHAILRSAGIDSVDSFVYEFRQQAETTVLGGDIQGLLLANGTVIDPGTFLRSYTVLNNQLLEPTTVTPQVNPRTVPPQVDPRTVTPQVDPRTVTPQVDPKTVTPQVDPRTVTPQVDPRAVTPQVDTSKPGK